MHCYTLLHLDCYTNQGLNNAVEIYSNKAKNVQTRDRTCVSWHAAPMLYLLIYPDDTYLTQFTANETSISLFWLNYRACWSSRVIAGSSQVKFSETMKWNFNRYFFIRWNLMNKFVMNFMKIKCFCTKYICSVFVIDIFGFNDNEKSRSSTIYSERVTLKRYLKFWISVQLSVR